MKDSSCPIMDIEDRTAYMLTCIKPGVLTSKYLEKGGLTRDFN